MDQSIRNAEKLIEATNTALSQMMQDSSLDDFAGFTASSKIAAGGGRRKLRSSGNGKTSLSTDFNLDDVRHLLGIKEKTIEELFNFDTNYSQTFRKSSSRRDDDKIEEINNKIEVYKQEQIDREEKASLRLDKNELARCSSSEHAVARTISDTNVSVTKGRSSVRDDLKSKLKETQDIVDRGIQTARELRQTVEVLSDKPQRWDDGSRSSEKPAKSDTTAATAVAEAKRCKRCHARLKSNRRERRRENVSVMRVTGTDAKPTSRRRLNTQQLPSLTIHGDLKCQKIPSVDIPPGKPPEFAPTRVNAALETYTHDQILRDRIERIMREFVVVDSAREVRVRCVECLNCGKAVRVSDRVVDAERIDDLLRSCDYNVFDPRIDQFVEGVQTEEGVQFVQAESERSDKDRRPQPSPRVATPPPKMEEPVRRPRIGDLSRELTRKYNEKVVELDRDHMEFDRLIRDLLTHLDEGVPTTKPSLSMTTPVMLSYTGSGEEADDGRNAVLRPNRKGRTSKEVRKTRELRTNCKVISSSCPDKTEASRTPSPPKPPPPPPPRPRNELERPRPVANITISLPPRPVAPLTISSESESPTPAHPAEVPELQTKSPPSPAAVKEPSDYESDFEDETMAEPLPDDDEDDDADEKFNVRLSTITEVDSEVDRKLSERSIRTKEIASMSSLSTDDDDTRKLLKKVNKDLKEVASQHLASTTTKREVTEPLKEVLTALRSQFERTEHLAEKLTESIREVKSERDGKKKVDEDDDGFAERKSGNKDVLSMFTSDTDILTALRKSSFARGSEEEPESGRVVRSESQRLTGHIEAEAMSPVQSEANRIEKSYSEGEISEHEICTEVSSPSIGEVINENIGSDGSVSDDGSNSVMNFHFK